MQLQDSSLWWQAPECTVSSRNVIIQLQLLVNHSMKNSFNYFIAPTTRAISTRLPGRVACRWKVPFGAVVAVVTASRAVDVCSAVDADVAAVDGVCFSTKHDRYRLSGRRNESSAFTRSNRLLGLTTQPTKPVWPSERTYPECRRLRMSNYATRRTCTYYGNAFALNLQAMGLGHVLIFIISFGGSPPMN